ncbi:MAG: hypothetical protein UV51_C0007G0002 [Candidatus Woesebacteria bacterium GW2011_GWC1_42_9]|nr:MAG: hypothetical protein UV51_C0007G0002 [Candidatus Woesebacteria bacterium GW2011_GWC1_42_9]
MRNPLLLIATGGQGIGKSYTSLKQAIYQAYVAKFKRSSLIFDTNGEYAAYEIDGVTHRIKAIGHGNNDIIKFGNTKVPEVRRIAPFHANGMPMAPEEAEALLTRAVTFYRGGTLIIEDLNRIYGDSLPQTITGLLCNVRHRNCDVVFHLQSIGRILPKMRQNTKIIRYHYQLDSIEDSREKLAGEIEIYKIAEKMVNKQQDEGNTHFLIYVYREIKKLKGNFSNRMLSEAIQDYISENERVIKPLLIKRDLKGKKINSYETALNQKTVELFKKYQGNE